MKTMAEIVADCVAEAMETFKQNIVYKLQDEPCSKAPFPEMTKAATATYKAGWEDALVRAIDIVKGM